MAGRFGGRRVARGDPPSPGLSPGRRATRPPRLLAHGHDSQVLDALLRHVGALLHEHRPDR
eukprot:3766421-Alexandrium_andersonii.AAC.1